jgi:hypothetical protein
MTISKEQLDWFNNLPLIVRQKEGDKFERTCLCGATIWYEFANCQNVNSWIDVHFGHTAENIPLPKTPLVYDWSVAWKFSFDGFKAFLTEFGLDKEIPAVGDVRVFKDTKGNRFIFQLAEFFANDLEHPNENHYATFCPERSLVSL